MFPRREWPDRLGWTLLGVQLMFMPVGFQVELLQNEPLNWTRGLINAILCGTISVGWTLLGTFRMWWAMPLWAAAPMVVFPVIMTLIGRTGLYDMATMSRYDTMVTCVVLSIATLSMGFALLMHNAIGAYRARQSARAELDVARRVHESLVPPIEMTLPGVRIVARSRASSTMGGDLIDVVRRDGEVDVFVADVSGHGVKAGIVMAMLKAAVRTRLAAGGALGEILRDVNRVLGDLTDPSMFATLACVRVRARADGGADVEYALAGHLPILHLSADGTVRDLPNGSLPLGIEPGEEFAAGRTAAKDGDVLALLTDGLMEVQGRDGRELGMDALRAVVRASSGGTLEEMRRRIMERVDAHGAQIDDQSLALVGIGSGA